MKGRVGEGNVMARMKDSSEVVGLELMVISFMQSSLVNYSQDCGYLLESSA